MKQQNSLVLSMFFMTVLLLGSVSSWMPETHTFINEEALVQSPNSEVGKLINSGYYEDFIACDVLTDISVFYYFTEGFNQIGTKYKQTHTQNLCHRMIQLAKNDAQRACAYGVCAHHVQDAVSHNSFVPRVIRKTKLVNGLIHVFAEENANDQLITNELSVKVRQALVNVAPIHREFFRGALVSENSEFPFESMYDAFVAEVSTSEKYSIGFRGFSAVPVSIHFGLIMIFILSMMGMALLIKKKDRTMINKIFIVLLFLIAISIIGLYWLFYAGKLWVAFQYASKPISALMPTSGWEADITSAITETVNMMNGGSQYVLAVTPDPAGEIELLEASKTGKTLRTIVNGLIVALIGLFFYLNIKKKKK